MSKEWKKPPSVEKVRYEGHCDGCRKPLGWWKHDTNEFTSTGEIVCYIQVDCCRFGSIGTLCRSCIAEINDKMHRLNVTGGHNSENKD